MGGAAAQAEEIDRTPPSESRPRRPPRGRPRTSRLGSAGGASDGAGVLAGALHRVHLARWRALPPFATDRLTLLPTEPVVLRLERPPSDGTEAVVFTPFELIERASLRWSGSRVSDLVDLKRNGDHALPDSSGPIAVSTLSSFSM